ncbi:MAG: hypothetical protein IJ260_11505 [Butyrivibrio sp.]|nr:hypothetical protein [Butyrivibrio sp.]
MGKSTFIVKIDNHQKDTWQGEIVWADENKRRRFRSCLEMLKLMNEAWENSDDKEVKRQIDRKLNTQ